MSASFVTPWTVACQVALFMGFSRQEHWSGLPFPSPGDLPNLTIELASPALQVDSLPLSHQGRPMLCLSHSTLNIFISSPPFLFTGTHSDHEFPFSFLPSHIYFLKVKNCREYMAFPLYQNGKKISKRNHTNSMLGSSSGQFGPIYVNSMPLGPRGPPAEASLF